MTDDVMRRAVEAAAKAAQPYAFDDAFWLARNAPDRHQKHAQANARTAAEAAIRAALPILAADLREAIANGHFRARLAEMLEQKA